MNGRSLLFGAAIAGLAVAIGCSADPEGLSGPLAGASGPAAAAPAVTPEILEKGHGIYKANCTACHGETGKGNGPAAVSFKPAPRDHTDRAYMDKLTDKNIADVITMGGAVKGMPLMPSSPQIRGADLDALVAYVRSLSRK